MGASGWLGAGPVLAANARGVATLGPRLQ